MGRCCSVRGTPARRLGAEHRMHIMPVDSVQTGQPLRQRRFAALRCTDGTNTERSHANASQRAREQSAVGSPLPCYPDALHKINSVEQHIPNQHTICTFLLLLVLVLVLVLQVRCLVDVPGEKLPADLPSYLRTVVAPQVPQEVRTAFLTAIDKEAIRSMQNKQVSCQPMHQPGEQGNTRYK